MTNAQHNYEQKLDQLKEAKNVLICHYCQRKVSVEDEQNNIEDLQPMHIDQKTCGGVSIKIIKSDEDVEMIQEQFDQIGQVQKQSLSEQRAAGEMAVWLGVKNTKKQAKIVSKGTNGTAVQANDVAKQRCSSCDRFTCLKCLLDCANCSTTCCPFCVYDANGKADFQEDDKICSSCETLL